MKWADDESLDLDYRNFKYSIPAKNSIVLFYKPGGTTSNCLWVLDTKDSLNPYLPDSIRAALAISDLSRIQSQPFSENYPDTRIYGKEPEHTWCYYYQKAALAYQNQDWQQITRLGNEAMEAGFNPSISQANSPQEWIPFIEGYARTGNWGLAAELSDQLSG
jgi:hypothetical protein